MVSQRDSGRCLVSVRYSAVPEDWPWIARVDDIRLILLYAASDKSIRILSMEGGLYCH